MSDLSIGVIFGKFLGSLLGTIFGFFLYEVLCGRCGQRSSRHRDNTNSKGGAP